MKYKKLEDGQWSDIGEIHWITCCACCLTHVVEIQKVRGGYRLRAWRDNRATANKRRARGIKVTAKRVTI